MRRWLPRVLVLVLALAAVVLVAQQRGRMISAPHLEIPQRAAGCAKYASPSGSDVTGDGSPRNPYRSVSKLDDALAPGQGGCLYAGTYGGTSTVHQLDNSGNASHGITISPYPGETAKLVGLIELKGSFTTISGLAIDGSNTLYARRRPGTTCTFPVSNGLEVDGANDVFQYNDFYQSIPRLRGNGIGIGWNGQADNTIIRFNRIHDVGQCLSYDQMIYLARGNGVQIYRNWMWNDRHGWGVQLYPAARNAHVYDNVIDAAGSGFTISGDSGVSGNVIDHNVVMNSTGLPQAGLAQGVGLSDSWSSTPGSGNVFERNDVFDNPGGVAHSSGVALSGNTTRDPGLVDPGAHDYAVAAGSPLANWGLWDGVAR